MASDLLEPVLLNPEAWDTLDRLADDRDDEFEEELLELDELYDRAEPELNDEWLELTLKPELLAKTAGAAQPVASARAVNVAASRKRMAFMLVTSFVVQDLVHLGQLAKLAVSGSSIEGP